MSDVLLVDTFGIILWVLPFQKVSVEMEYGGPLLYITLFPSRNFVTRAFVIE